MKIIDISHVLDNDTPIYPDDYKTTLTISKTIENDCYNAYLLQSGLHTGTHIDMPMHLIEDSKTAADFQLDSFIGNGVILDVRGERTIEMKPEYHEKINKGDVVLLFTGHDKNYSKAEYFTDYPTVSEELADFLLSKQIKMLGMDMPAPDYQPFEVHNKLLCNNIFILENLTNLQSLVGVDSFGVVAFPLKINAEASFTRAACMIIE